MLRVADGYVEEAADDAIVPSPAVPLSVPSVTVRFEDAPARYGARRGPNVPAILVIVLLHAVLIAALVQVRHHAQRVREARLSVVNLMPPPPPPPSAEAPPPPPQTKIVAPPPLVKVPQPPAPAVATTPEIVPPAPPAPPVALSSPPAPPAASMGSSLVQGGDLGAQMIAGKPPRYPVESRRRREQGTVVLALTLGLDGAVENLSIAQSSGFPRLDNAARDAVRGWRWKPVMRDGQAVRVKGVVEIPFVLRGGAA
ncbi:MULTISPECIES: energy transducer TonB [Sphingobium]|jgi:protein TonB|uniref:Energy transducer TonB n=1 Tax=Sphingobium fuliginis (strain ATCC 27551) TaxID=336203 RepID=A0A292ZIH4_SPHSA|nr:MULTISPECIES: energy transducer TonB [Sphingobium]QOT71667.1 energy transducer TonB [Sphingobium fuliginis]GAY22639.1 ferric siderophore transport system, periplasmic binding protein TonB [Sphingobium fuliginis]